MRRCFLVAAVLLAGCVENAPAPLRGNLLADRPPTAAPGVWHTDRLTDGLAPHEGDYWLTGLTTKLGSAYTRVTWDLGAPKPIRCALVQGDNNDAYDLYGSQDGRTWDQLWIGDAVNGAGMRTRHGQVQASFRYVRLSARGGDGMYSVGEVGLFSECPKGWPDVPFVRGEGEPLEKTAQRWMLWFGAAAILFLLFHRAGGPRWPWLVGGATVLAGVMTTFALVEIYPFANTNEESLLRAVVAAIAGVLVAKEALFSPSHAPHPRVTKITLGVLAVLAVGCYYHFASPQFMDHAKGRRTLVHTFDMRHYFPTAKYFRELRFDGLYLGSLAAYLDIVGDTTVDRVKHVNLRDLNTYDMISAEQAAPRLAEIRARFSPERWEEFKRDMKYLVDTMGPGDYLGSMQDHGGNATPVWLLGAYAIFKNAPANELTLSLAGLIDPVLLLFFFVVLYRTFGWRVTLYTIVLFGATDFYQFGSNLMGSTLRQDWLVALGLGACALKKGRPFLGGFLMAYGGLIRAFPALAAMFLVVPAVWWLVDWVRQRRAAGKPVVPREAAAALRVEQRTTLRAVGGAAAAVLGLVLLSSALFGWKGAWVTWFAKIEMHAVGPSTNNVGLRNVVSWRPWTSARYLIRSEHPEPWVEWQRLQVASFAQLRPLFYLLNLLAFAAVMLACRKRPLHQTALLGLLLIPFLFYPSNYYCHFIFLLPIALAVEGPGATRDRSFAWSVLVLAAICVGQYFTMAEGWTDLRYTYQSMVLLVGMAAIIVPLAREGWRDLRPRPTPAPSPAPVPEPASPA
jgi:hypothetical protein